MKKRKYTLLGEFMFLENVALKMMQLKEYETSRVEQGKSVNSYMNKTVLAMGEIDKEELAAILPKVRVLVYIGNDHEVRNIITEFCEEKDLCKNIDNVTIGSGIEVWSNDKFTIEVYTSMNFSTLELLGKYILKSGPKLFTLMKYVSQIVMQRSSLAFDVSLGDIRSGYDNFLKYHEDCEEKGIPYDEQELIKLSKNFKHGEN